MSISYNKLDKAIADIGTIDSASFLHGWMSGILIYSHHTYKKLDSDWILQRFIEEYELKPKAHLKSMIIELFEKTIDELGSEDFSSYLLLHDSLDDAQDMDNQAIAYSLMQWVTGFIYAIGNIMQFTYNGEHSIPEDIKEIISDLSQLSSMDIESVGDSEDENLQVVEMIEFTKVCMLNLRQDFLLQQNVKTD